MKKNRKLKELRNRLIPFATRQNALKALNPVLNFFSSRATVQARLKTVLALNKIEFLDLGGCMPVEGYLTIHLSSVEPYGIIMTPASTLELVFDERAGLPVLQARDLRQPAVSLHFDIFLGLPLENESMQGVNLSHILEHFELEKGREILKECHRVLRPGGVLRISCPDLKKYARAYLEKDEAFFAKASAPAYCNYHNLPSQGAVFAGKAYDAHNGHKWFYDANTVMVLLQALGFSTVTEVAMHFSSLPQIADIEPAYREAESFYVEAVR